MTMAKQMQDKTRAAALVSSISSLLPTSVESGMRLPSTWSTWGWDVSRFSEKLDNFIPFAGWRGLPRSKFVSVRGLSNIRPVKLWWLLEVVLTFWNGRSGNEAHGSRSPYAIRWIELLVQIKAKHLPLLAGSILLGVRPPLLHSRAPSFPWHPFPCLTSRTRPRTRGSSSRRRDRRRGLRNVQRRRRGAYRSRWQWGRRQGSWSPGRTNPLWTRRAAAAES